MAGSRWSLSDVIGPGEMLLDSAYLNAIMPVRTGWLTDGYVNARSSRGFVPVFAPAPPQSSQRAGA